MLNQAGFDELSPDVGLLDTEALEQRWEESPTEALTMLTMMSRATDRRLAEQARRLAGRLAIDLTASRPTPGFGFGPRHRTRAKPDSTELDFDAGLEQVLATKSEGRSPSIDDLVAVERTRPGTAMCLLVDFSGSMNGTRLATAALATAACCWRSPDEFAVLAFADHVLELKSLSECRPPEAVIGDVLTLRGHGTTDVALALRSAARQLARARARRRITILLSDAEVTTGDDPVGPARRCEDLSILAPEDEPSHAEALASAAGARLLLVSGPESIPAALRSATDRRR